MKQGLVWIDALFQKQKIVCLLEVDKIQIVLTHFGPGEQDSRGDVYFCSSYVWLLMLIEMHVHNNFDLSHALVWLDLHNFLLLFGFAVN